ncbi:glycosyltransferase [Paenibacillus daejeonensis]|uniref:glycosyltransferase family protein n=1 Tax=Paenibacillus daejeonensis TaxID=135193 RepID=UPI00038023BF|nr:glycosyltransferase [Paenibacillus daejeonensis]
MKTSNQRILMCYNKTPITPGRYLEEALRAIGVHVDVHRQSIDFGKVDLSAYAAVLFAEGGTSVKVSNLNLVKLPKFYWVTHGSHRIDQNVQIAKKYQADYVLMAQFMKLSHRFSAETFFFPFALDQKYFNCSTPLKERDLAVGFVGSHVGGYESRDKDLSAIQKRFGGNYKLSLRSTPKGPELANVYSKSKIVYNQSPNYYKAFNMRLFEGMGCGALVLTNHNTDQDRVFEAGKHYVQYEKQEDMLDKIEYYLNHLDQAQKIANQGRAHLLNHHTYEHRAKYFMSLLK